MKKYAVDTELIRKNGCEVGLPKYTILGANIDLNTPVELHIKSPFPSKLKISALLREKLNLSQNAFKQMIASGAIRGDSGLDLKKCRL